MGKKRFIQYFSFCRFCELEKHYYLSRRPHGDVLVNSWILKIQRSIMQTWTTDQDQPQAFVELEFHGVIKETTRNLLNFRYNIYSEEIAPIDHARKADKTDPNIRTPCRILTRFTNAKNESAEIK